jgi:hypothetical protein
MNAAISDLAEKMNVSYHDVMAMAAGIVRGIEADKVTDMYLNNESERLAMCEMYMKAHVEKVQKIQIDYLTKPEYAHQLRTFVRSSLAA